MGQKCQGGGSFEKGRGKECGYESACLPVAPCALQPEWFLLISLLLSPALLKYPCSFQNSEENFGLTHDPLT